MRLRLIVAATLGLISSAAYCQDPPASGSTTLFLGLQEPTGGSRLDLTWTTTKEAEGRTMPLFDCVRECNGGKHAKHSECDLSCDSACKGGHEGKHLAWVRDELSELDATRDAPPAQSHGSVLSRDMTTFRLPSILRGERVLSHVKDSFRQPSDSLVSRVPTSFQVELPHWNEMPCSVSSAKVGADSYIVSAKYVIFEAKINADKSVTRVEGPSGTMRWRLLIPVSSRVTYGESTVNCRCEATQTPPKEHGFLPGNRGEGAYAYVAEMGMRRAITGLDLRDAIQGIAAQDMNYATVTFNPLPMRDYYIPDGWELECIDGDGQDLQINDWTFISDMPRFEFASIDGGQAPAQEKKLRVLCLNIDKPEPKPGMNYRLAPPKNPLASRLSAITKASRIRGPWDQMRLWIVTDAAPYDKIAKTLVPAPGPGTYVREMYRAASVRAFSPFDDRYRPIMEYRHLLAKNYDPAAVAWYAKTKLRQNPAATLTWFRSSTAEISGLFGQGAPKEEAELIGILAASLAEEGGADGVKTAIWLITQAVPEGNRAAVMESAGAQTLGGLLSSPPDAPTALLILDWLATAKPSFAGMAASNVHPKLPQEVQDRATKLRESLRTAG